MKNKFFIKKKKKFDIIKKKVEFFKDKLNFEENINFLNEKYKLKKKNQKSNINVEIKIPNKYLTIKELAVLSQNTENKIRLTLKSLNLSDKNIISPEESILLMDCLNIIAVLINIENNNHIEIFNNYAKQNPLVTIIGNVDNGKTSLINKLCKNEYKPKKLITQGIDIKHKLINNKEFIFLDTPGHKDLENFKDFTMKISNIILLILNSLENINNSIINIIEFSKTNNLLLIIIINKIDIINNKSESIKNKLINLKSKFKYNYIINKTSIKTNTGINKLTKLLILSSKLLVNENSLQLTNNFKGIIMENILDKKLGLISLIIVKSGNIKLGSFILCNNKWGVVKSIYNHKDEIIEQSMENSLIKITGFNEIPDINDIIISLPSKNLVKRIAEFREYKSKIMKNQNNTFTENELVNYCKNPNIKNKLNIIIKSKSNGIIKSIQNVLYKIKFNSFELNFIKSSPGNISISDIKLAKTVNAILIAFNIDLSSNIKLFSKNLKIEIISYKLIYDLINYIKNLDIKRENKKDFSNILGVAKVNKIFNSPTNKIKSIAGCFVIYGRVKLLSNLKIFRNNKEIYTGNIDSIKYLKTSVKEVKKGFECGILINNFNNYMVNDIIKLYENL